MKIEISDSGTISLEDEEDDDDEEEEEEVASCKGVEARAEKRREGSE